MVRGSGFMVCGLVFTSNRFIYIFKRFYVHVSCLGYACINAPYSMLLKGYVVLPGGMVLISHALKLTLKHMQTSCSAILSIFLDLMVHAITKACPPWLHLAPTPTTPTTLLYIMPSQDVVFDKADTTKSSLPMQFTTPCKKPTSKLLVSPVGHGNCVCHPLNWHWSEGGAKLHIQM